MSKLDDIILNIPGCVVETPNQNYKTVHRVGVETKQDLKALMLELVGEGQEFKAHELNTASSQEGWKEYNKKQFSMKDIDNAIVNELRELRQKVDEL